MHETAPTMSREEVAKALGIAPETLGNKLKALYAEGFPRPLPRLRVWSRKLVLDWINWQDQDDVEVAA